MTLGLDHTESVIDQASAWVVRLGGDEVSDSDYEALGAWLDLSPSHRAAFEEAEGLWAELGGDRAALDAALTRSAPRTSVRGTRRPDVSRRWIWGAGGLAAAALACAVLIGPALLSPTQTYVAAPGEQRTISLSDGSTIAMNGGSTLSVRMSGQERRVEMADAEAAFDVAHDADRPFRVTVGESRIEVLGTAFDVRRDGDTTKVNVTRGVVRVSDLQDAGHNVRLTIGQSVTRTDAIGELRVAPGSTVPAGWRAGQLIYNDRPLSEVVEDLNRAYPMPIRAVNGADRLRFTGVLALDGQDETLRRLQLFLPIAVDRRDAIIELRPR
ncbi:MAG TPA: FecR domain-containing protein [Brevundimonas sp.]|jgi:transmembrane sensor